MKTRLFLLLSLIFGLLQGPFLPPVLVEGALVLIYFLSTDFKRSLLPILVSGVIFDLVQSQPLGLTSLVFIASCGVLEFLRQEFPFQKPLYLAIFSVLIDAVRWEVVFRGFPLWPLGFGFVVSFVLFSVLRQGGWRLVSPGKIRVV